MHHSIYFVVGLVLQWINCDPSLKDFLNCCHCKLHKQQLRVYVFVDMMLFSMQNRILLKFLKTR